MIGVGTFTVNDRMRELVQQVLDSGRISYGPLSRELEKRFARIHGCAFGILSNSGTSSLQVTLQAMKELYGWDDGDEVITQSVTFVATVNVILHNRLKPILVDIDDCYGLDPNLLERAITKRTRAIIPVHLFGQPCDMWNIDDIATQYSLKVLEDSCFTGNTLIPTKKGQKRIKDICVGDRLLGFDGISFKETTVVGTSNRLVDYTDILNIKFENGLTVHCTKEHPFYVDGQWMRADELKVDDEVWQCNWSEYTTWRREYELSERGRQIISENMKKNNPSYDPATIRKAATNRRHGKSLIETRVITTCQECGIPIDYIGDGALWIGADGDAYKNPDFIVRGKKIVIEVYDPTFLYHKSSNVHVDRDESWREERRAFFARYGYRTEFIELSGYVGRDTRKKLAQRLRQIVSNGVRIVSIKPTKKGFVKRYNSKVEPDGMVRVYNLHCEPYNNFILASGILVHNCETMFVMHRDRMVWGDAACYSMYVAHLLTAGVGGLTITNDPPLAVKVRSLVNHGRDGIYLSIDDDDGAKGEKLREIINRRFRFESVGHSYRITELEAALALGQLDDWQEMIHKRQENAAYICAGLSDLEWVHLPKNRRYTAHSYMMLPLVCDADKPALCSYLETKGIETREMLPLTNQPVYQGLWNPKDYPRAERVNEKGFYIGCHQDLTRDNLDQIIDAFRGWKP